MTAPTDAAPPAEGFRRARSPARKALRRAALLRAAAELVDADGPEGVSLAAIAARAGGAKSNVYRYFESREEILARLLVEELTALSREMEATLAGLPANAPPASLAGIVARGFEARPRLCRLAAVFATVLERNISAERLTEVKRETLAATDRIAAAMARAYPEAPAQDWPMFLTASFALVTGLWPLANAPEHVRAAAAAAGYPARIHEFRPLVEAALGAMLAGLAAGPSAAPEAVAAPEADAETAARAEAAPRARAPNAGVRA